MKQNKRFAGMREGRRFITIGLLLIAAALSLVCYNLYDENRAGESVGQAMEQLNQRIPTVPEEKEADLPAETQEVYYEQELVIPDYVLSPEMDMPVETIKKKDYIGVLKIPALELELPVISQLNDDNLKVAPCRYMGSVYLNNMIICGHNYKTHFLKLKKLSLDDPVIFTDVDGNIFEYKVSAQEVILATDPDEMESGDWDLTLFTCTVGGRTRDTVRCVLVNCIPNTRVE